MPKKKSENYGFDSGGWVYPEGKGPASYGAAPKRRPVQSERSGSAYPPRSAPRPASSANTAQTRSNQRPSGSARPQSATQGAIQGAKRSAANDAMRQNPARGGYSQSFSPPRGGAPGYQQAAPKNSFNGALNGGGGGVRADRRAAFLREEEARRQAAARAAWEEKERVRRMQEEAARAEAEKRRREAYRRKMEAARREEARRRMAEERRKAEKRRRRRHAFRVIRFHLKVALLSFLIITVLLSGAAYLKFYRAPSGFSGKVTYVYGTDKITKIPASLAYSDGNMRFDFSKLAEYLGFSVSGDSESFKYVIASLDSTDSSGRGDEQYIKFYLGQTTAVINGTPVNLPAVSEYKNSSLWVSCDILDFFSSGLSFQTGKKKVEIEKKKTYDENNKVIRDEEGNFVYEDISLVFKPAFPPAVILVKTGTE